MDSGECITVVIPIYNVEQYLKENLESVIKQTYTNLDIILVDDGSTDNSGFICELYARQDERITVIHKANGGLSEARNSAIQIAKGEYITFVDSDDIISKKMVEFLWYAIKSCDCDISICGFSCFRNTLPHTYDSEKYKNPIYLTGISAIELMFYQIHSDVSASYKLYRTALFKDIKYPKGLIFEDLATTYKLFLKSKKVAYIDTPLYFYRQRQGSIRHSEFKLIDMCALDIIQNIQLDLINSQNFEALKKSFYARSLSIAFQVLMKEIPLDFSNYEQELFYYIKQFRASVLFDRKARSKTRIAALLSFGGSGICRKIYNHIFI